MFCVVYLVFLFCLRGFWICIFVIRYLVDDFDLLNARNSLDYLDFFDVLYSAIALGACIKVVHDFQICSSSHYSVSVISSP
jgi:hypothetical protein